MTSEVTVTLNEFEARALAHMGSMWADALGDISLPSNMLPDGAKVRPLESAVMKLTVALVCEGAEL